MTSENHRHVRCPRCGGPTVRIRRLAEDRIASVAAPLRRYRCTDSGCGWEDAIAVAPDASRRRRARRDARKRAQRPRRIAVGASLATGLLLALAAAQAWQLYRNALPDPVLERAAANRPLVPFGQSHDGEPLPGDHPLLVRVADAGSSGTGPALATDALGDAPATGAPVSAPTRGAPIGTAVGKTTIPALTDSVRFSALADDATADSTADGPADDAPLTLRQNCAWGDPGRDPYRGTVEQALEGARLPPEVAKRLAAMIRAGQATDRLEITTASIRTVHQYREYDPESIAMTFGKTLCVNTKVNFKPGHMERADLYEVADAGGATYSVMVPYVCGNVSVLSDRAERPDEKAAAPVMVLGPDGRPVLRKTSAPLPGVIAGNLVRNPRTGTGNKVTTQQAEGQVPVPGTLANLLGGSVLLAWFIRRRARKPEGE